MNNFLLSGVNYEVLLCKFQNYSKRKQIFTLKSN